MRPVQRGNIATLPAVAAKVNELCDASQQVTEEIADAYSVTTPANFTPVRSLDLTDAITIEMLSAVVATFFLDLKQRGTTRRTSSV